MELAIGRDLFTRFIYSDPDTMVDAIEAFADEMDARADRLRGVVRKFAVSEATPLKLLVIDELATLTLYAGPMIAARANGRSVESYQGRRGRVPGSWLRPGPA